VAAAAEALARQGFVTPVDVCLGLGWLHASNVDDWRRGRVDDLEDYLPVHGDRITELIVCLDSWAGERPGTDWGPSISPPGTVPASLLPVPPRQ
jgi:hypothetical protein